MKFQRLNREHSFMLASWVFAALVAAILVFNHLYVAAYALVAVVTFVAASYRQVHYARRRIARAIDRGGKEAGVSLFALIVAVATVRLSWYFATVGELNWDSVGQAITVVCILSCVVFATIVLKEGLVEGFRASLPFVMAIVAISCLVAQWASFGSAW